MSIVDMEFVKNREITGFSVNAIEDIVVKIALREQIVSKHQNLSIRINVRISLILGGFSRCKAK
jgi:hypothetical protein